MEIAKADYPFIKAEKYMLSNYPKYNAGLPGIIMATRKEH
jgi:hypothetical protein